ncbi:hypothetical protein [Baia soyae]|nr:hypothetical protein [Baia soyae]
MAVRLRAMLAILLSVVIRSTGRFWCNMSERTLRVLHLPRRRMTERTCFSHPCRIAIEQ